MFAFGNRLKDTDGADDRHDHRPGQIPRESVRDRAAELIPDAFQDVAVDLETDGLLVVVVGFRAASGFQPEHYWWEGVIPSVHYSPGGPGLVRPVCPVRARDEVGSAKPGLTCTTPNLMYWPSPRDRGLSQSTGPLSYQLVLTSFHGTAFVYATPCCIPIHGSWSEAI